MERVLSYYYLPTTDDEPRYPSVENPKSNIIMSYPFAEIEARWQRYWMENGVFRTDIHDHSRPKYYMLDMYPYPSGDGLHVGHPEGYTATDIIARYKRHNGA